MGNMRVIGCPAFNLHSSFCILHSIHAFAFFFPRLLSSDTARRKPA
jgi:hypothetical protein